MGSFTLDTFIGKLIIHTNAKSITAIELPRQNTKISDKPLNSLSTLEQQAHMELSEYFQGKRQKFNISLHLAGTPFQLKVWHEVSSIPYGTVCSYQDIAIKIGKPLASRAVGMAIHCNPVPIIIPCHRVIGKNGQLTGYAGGLLVKEKLLNFEHTTINRENI